MDQTVVARSEAALVELQLARYTAGNGNVKLFRFSSTFSVRSPVKPSHHPFRGLGRISRSERDALQEQTGWRGGASPMQVPKQPQIRGEYSAEEGP